MTKAERMQAAFRQYQVEHGYIPSGTRPVVEWAVANGILEEPDVDPYAILANEMARALRDETDVDEKGRRYRVNQAVKFTEDGTQFALWGIGEFVSPQHSIRSFAQRREGVIGDLVQLQTDSDHHNDRHPGNQYQLYLDFSDDVAERMIQEKAA